MKTETQRRVEWRELCALIEDITVVMLTNHDADGALITRPMSPLEMDSTGALWFFTDARAAKAEQLHMTKLSFTDSAQSLHVSLSGRGEIDTDRARIDRLWTPMAKPRFADGPGSPHLALLKFVPDTVEYKDARLAQGLSRS